MSDLTDENGAAVTLFAQWRYPVSISSASHCTAAVYADAQCTLPCSAFKAGETFYLTVTPDEGYFDLYAPSVTCGEGYLLPDVGSNGYYMPAGAVSVTAACVPGSVSSGRIYANAGAVLILAEYDGSGRMVEAQTLQLLAKQTGTSVEALGLALPNAYRLMLVDASTFAPLCEAWSKS